MAELDDLEAWEALGVSEALAAPEVWGEWEALAVLEGTDGSTTLPTVEARRIEIVLRPIDLAARLVATRWLTDRPAHGIRSGGRAAIWPATTAAASVGAMELVATVAA